VAGGPCPDCSFSVDKQHLSVCGSAAIQLFAPTLDLFGPQQLARQGSVASPAQRVAWSPFQTNLFAVAVSLCHPAAADRLHEVQLYSGAALAARHATMARVNCLLWTTREPLLLAGQEDGRIAVLRAKGTSQLQLESYLLFHKSPVLCLQESPCAQYVCSIGQDEVLMVWKHQAEQVPASVCHSQLEVNCLR